MDDSIGASLKQAREKRGLSIQQVADATKVRSHYLQALENDDLSAIPSGAQARGFLRIYAEFLGLDLAALVPAPKPAESVPPAANIPDADLREPSSEPTAPNPNLPEVVRNRLSQLAARLSGGRKALEAGQSAEADIAAPDANRVSQARPATDKGAVEPDASEGRIPAASKKKSSLN